MWYEGCQPWTERWCPIFVDCHPFSKHFCHSQLKRTSSSSCAKWTYRPWPHLISTPSFMCLRLFHTAKVFYFPLFLPVLDTCRRGGDALACVGQQESWPGLGLLGNCCSLPRRGGEGKMRLSYFGQAGAGVIGVWGRWTTSQEHRKVQEDSVQGSGLVHFFFTVWAGTFVGGGVLIMGYRQFPFILLLKFSHS